MMETLIISTILLLFFICLRRMLDGKIPARLQYGILLFIVVRLLLTWIPLPGSNVSIMNLVPVVQDFLYENQDKTGESDRYLGQGASGSQANGELVQESVLSQNDTLSQDSEQQQMKTGSQSGEKQQVGSKAFQRGNGSAAALFSIVYKIYGIGAGIVLLWMTAKNFRFWAGLRRRRILYEGELPVAALPGRLYLIEQLKSPFLFGRHIYVSPEMIGDPQKLRHILVHETCHWKQGDGVWSILRCLCLAVYWYHPLVWYGVHLSIVDAELACDERAVRILGEENGFRYGETLLDLIRNQEGFLECTCVSTQMSGSKQETKKRLERIVERRKQTRGRILFLVVSMLLLCLVTLPGKQIQSNGVAEKEWQRVEQEGFPCIVVDEQGNIVGTRRGELLRKVVLDYLACDGNTGLDYRNYQIQADAFSACPNLKTLILPDQNRSLYVIDYIDPDAFRGCSEDLVVYCDKGSYAWARLQELGITVKEIMEEDWQLLGEDPDALKRIQEKIDSGENDAELTEKEMRQFYGEPFFMMTESGQLFHSICESLTWYVMENREIYFPTDAHTLAGIFPQYLMNQQITIPKNIVVIGDSSFLCCQLPEIAFEEGSRLQTIGGNAFTQNQFTEIQLPEGLLEIGNNAFSDCSNLIEITIPESVHTIGSRCFRLCGSLERVVILNPDISIGEDVFDDEIIDPKLGEDEIDMEDLDSNFIPNDRLTIVCHQGSNAEKYAREHGLQVEYLE
ncbi:MAG: leucine-rich repeat protein [Lachnospiraceae bacterium]|nr:leucine-rich repeat protein [Lachnospiraceae bacterium]